MAFIKSGSPDHCSFSIHARVPGDGGGRREGERERGRKGEGRERGKGRRKRGRYGRWKGEREMEIL